MKNEVVVTGATLTSYTPVTVVLKRSQVEQAVKDLNEPRFKLGNVVKYANGSSLYVVLGGWIEGVARGASHGSVGDVVLLQPNTGTVYITTPANWELVRESI